MPATNKTANYGLCQYLPTDILSTDDWNEDNEKIDEAIHNVAAASLKTTTKGLTYYVDEASGNDDNDGLTEGTAFKTIQHAVDVLPKCIAHQVNIYLAEGTYAEDVAINLEGVGEGFISINGGSTLEAAVNYIISSLHARGKICVKLKGITVNGYNTNNAGISSTLFAFIQTADCRIIGTTSKSGFLAQEYGILRINNSYIENCANAILVNLLGTVFIYNLTGSGNTTGLNAQLGSCVHIGTVLPPGFATTETKKVYGSLIVNTSGNL